MEFMTFSDKLWTLRSAAMASCIILFKASMKVMLTNSSLQALNKSPKDRWSTLSLWNRLNILYLAITREVCPIKPS